MVCMDPIGYGRNVPKMLKLAESFRGQGHILMTTGFQKGSLYDPRTSFLTTVETEKAAALMIAEIAEGMDRHSYNGPVVERLPAKASLIKAGTSTWLITCLEEKALNVAALTQRETGCPISLHTDQGTMCPEILNILEENRACAEHTVLCYVQRNPDRYYYKMLLDKGANLCFDEPNKPQYRPDTEIAENILWLVEQGYQAQILLGMDAGRREGLGSYMEPRGRADGLDYMLTRFVPVLRWVGVSDAAIHAILEENPARIFSIRS